MKRRFEVVNYLWWNFLFNSLNQRCPTHSPLATCGEWAFKCGEWLYFQIFKKCYVLNKNKVLRKGNEFQLILIHTFLLKPQKICNDKSWPRMYLLKFSWLLSCVRQSIAGNLFWFHPPQNVANEKILLDIAGL